MDTEPSDAPAAIYPGWVMLNHHGLGRRHCFPADANNTVASCLSSAGKRIHASFRLAAPPGNSALFLDWPDVRDIDQLQPTEPSPCVGEKAASVVYAEGARWDEVYQWWETDSVVLIGDQFLCWGDYFRGLLLCDAFDLDEPVLQYVHLPLERNQGRPHSDLRRPFKNARNIGTTAGCAVRFVSVDRRRCCCGLLESSCPRSRFSFTVTTWTLNMDSLTWSRDGVLHSDELWALPGHEGLPRVTPEFPVLNMDDADAVCLMVRHYDVDASRIWMIKVDTRSKTLLSLVPYNSARYKPMNDDDEDDVLPSWLSDESEDHFDGIGFIRSEVSNYL
ncbi:hypothetical protein ACQ4PT_038354 [Festuca glaucescens]